MEKVAGVVGAGQMGSGIGQVLAQADYQVAIYDIAPAQLDRALQTIVRNLEKQVKKGALEADAAQAIRQRLTTTRELEALTGCELVVEAASENEALKLDLFRRLDGCVNAEAILATNTSSISITKIAAATRRPDKVIGMHFMNPVPVMQLVEVIRGQATGEATFQAIAVLVARLGKTMAVSADYPGFIVNRILIPMINEAVFALEQGVATAEDIDTGMRLGTNQPMGPLALADFIGLDTVLAISNVLFDGFKDSKYRPCPLLVKMVGAGQLGRKSGRGFYTY